MHKDIEHIECFGNLLEISQSKQGFSGGGEHRQNVCMSSKIKIKKQICSSMIIYKAMCIVQVTSSPLKLFLNLYIKHSNVFPDNRIWKIFRKYTFFRNVQNLEDDYQFYSLYLHDCEHIASKMSYYIWEIMYV